MATKHVRKNTRFKSEPGTLAAIEFPVKSKTFKEMYKGMVLTEAHGGCSMVIVYGPDLMQGDQCRVVVGNLAPLRAEVRWVVPLDEQIQKVGFRFLE